MADIFYNLKEGLDDSDEAMEIDDVEKDDVDYNLSPNASETGICNVGGSGDEGERDELLLKLQQYVTSDTNFTRQRIGRILVETFRTAANNGTKLNVNDIMLLVQQIIQDPDPLVRLDLMEQLPHVATICQEAPHLFGDVLHDHLLNIIVTYLLDEENQVRMTTQAVVLTLMKNGLLDSTTIEVKICPVIEVLCRSSMDFLQSGISLMSKTAPLIGKRLTEKIFLDRYIALSKDKDIYVRKVCASHFGEICVSVGRKAFLRKLFPVFVDLCCDKAWGIRRACVHVMMPVACCMTLQERQLLLAELLAMHLDDESKWVRMSAFQILGPFISTFAKQFTEVTCNQHGELVFTSQQDTRFRYSYEGNYPPKYMVRGHSFDQEELDSKDNFNSSVIIRRSISDDEDDDDDDESQEDHIFALRAYKSKIQKRLNQNQSMDDTEKYNPFLYYYIAPDLPLDDELVEAAKKSSAKNNTDWKPMTDTASSKASSLDDVVDEDQFPEVELMIVNDEELVPLHLVKMFLTMAEPERYSDIGADILQHCAFSFPAVALTLGREHWHYLLPTYKQLLVADQWKVRRTLASSIHEIATILGEEQTAIHLVPVYHRFIKDVDEVRISALKHLAAFLKILKPIDRSPYLPKLKEFLVTDNEWNWRFREELAIQLLEIVNLFAPTQLERYIVPLSFELLNDKVAAVRHVALSLVAQIVAQSGSERMVSALFHELKYSLGVYAKKWTRRQTLVFVCAQLITNNAISGQKFSKEMLPTLLKLSMDKVPNVRLAVARTLSKNVIPMGPSWLGVEQTKKVEKRLREMRSDPDRDVRVLAGGDEKPVLNILSQTNAEQSRNILF